MRADQKIAVVRVSRRRLVRHITALRVGVAQARAELATGELDDAPQAQLERTVSRVEAEIARLEAQAMHAPPADDPDAPLFYDASARD